MPAIQRRITLASQERGNNPLSNWDYQYAPFNGMCRIGANHNGAAGSVQWSIRIGSDAVLFPNSDMSAGGTDGVMPAPLNVPYIEFMVRQGDRITVGIDELGSVATTDIGFFCAIDPI